MRWATRALGGDGEGREILTWIPGATVTTGQEIDLPELTQMVRSLHDLTADFAPGNECVIHHDLSPGT